jgi:hypothetical protein
MQFERKGLVRECQAATYHTLQPIQYSRPASSQRHDRSVRRGRLKGKCHQIVNGNGDQVHSTRSCHWSSEQRFVSAPNTQINPNIPQTQVHLRFCRHARAKPLHLARLLQSRQPHYLFPQYHPLFSPDPQRSPGRKTLPLLSPSITDPGTEKRPS